VLITLQQKHLKAGYRNDIQGVSEEIVNILGGGSMDNSEEISSYKHVSNFKYLVSVKIQLFEAGTYRSDICLLDG
jgi:hypothetical protein